MKSVKTYEVKIALGLKEGYNGSQHHWKEVIPVIQEYVDLVGLCVTVTPTTFVYTSGREDGVFIGLIDYPRFPKDHVLIRSHAYSIAHLLMTTFKQHRCTIQFPEDTYLLENDDES